jgi:hypothetical protein
MLFIALPIVFTDVFINVVVAIKAKVTMAPWV